MKIPHDLGAEGRGLLRRIGTWLDTENVQLDEHEVIVLVEAGRVADRLGQLRAALAALELTEPAAVRLLAEERLQRVALANLLLVRLALPSGLVDDEESPAGRSATSRRAQRAARARWSRVAQREMGGVS